MEGWAHRSTNRLWGGQKWYECSAQANTFKVVPKSCDSILASSNWWKMILRACIHQKRASSAHLHCLSSKCVVPMPIAVRGNSVLCDFVLLSNTNTAEKPSSERLNHSKRIIIQEVFCSRIASYNRQVSEDIWWEPSRIQFVLKPLLQHSTIFSSCIECL